MLSRYSKWYKKNPGLFWFISIALVVVIAWRISWLYIDASISNEDARGTFGDKFGFINSLFSGLALGGIIFSIFLQQKELSLQRKELQETREEFRDQNFQTTFFNLLKTQRQIIDELRILVPTLSSKLVEGTKEVAGRQIFVHCKAELKRINRALSKEKHSYFDSMIAHHEIDQIEEYFSMYEPIDPEEEEKRQQLRNKEWQDQFTLSTYKITPEEFAAHNAITDLEKKLISLYKFFFRRYSYAIGHYFRHLYNILLYLENCEEKKVKLIEDHSTEKKDEKVSECRDEFKAYAKFFKAQMEIPELFTLHYNVFTYPESKELYIKYGILHDLHEGHLIEKDHNIIKEFGLLK